MACTTKILIVDDDKEFREFLRDILRSKGFAIETAADGEQALGQLQDDSSFDLVISDVDMPGINGLELLERIKHNFKGIAVILMSVDTSEERTRKAKELGVEGFLLKPFRIDELLDRVQHHVSN